MTPSTKGQGSKRFRSEGIPEFMIVDTIPKDLWRWCTCMGSHEQKRVKEHLGHLVHLMEIDPRKDVIEALIPFWDPKNNVFIFSDFEMTPALKEIASFKGKRSSVRGADLRNKRPIIPKHVDDKEFLEILNINQTEKEILKNGCVLLEFLYFRYGQKDGFKNYRNQLSNQGDEEAWKTNGCFAFMVVFLGLIAFPKQDMHIDIRLAGVVKALTTIKSPTIIPMILADMFRALIKCLSGEMYFEGCNICSKYGFWNTFITMSVHPGLLQIGVIMFPSIRKGKPKLIFPKGIKACEEKLSTITSDEILWNYYRFPAKNIICMSSCVSFLVLIGLRGVQPYAPLRVIGQLARIQEISPNDDMSRFAYDTPPGFAFNSKNIIKIWYGSIISELC